MVVVVIIVNVVVVVFIIIHPDSSLYRDGTCYGEERRVEAVIGGSLRHSHASRSLGNCYLRLGLVLFVVKHKPTNKMINELDANDFINIEYIYIYLFHL